MKIEVPEIDASGFRGNMNDLLAATAFYIADSYRYYIAAVGAVDTGELLDSVHVVPGTTSGTFDEQRTYVVASADHARVVEFGWIDRGRGQASYPGRFPAQKAFESFMEKLVNGEFTDALHWRLGIK